MSLFLPFWHKIVRIIWHTPRCIENHLEM
jgi:hypothetical protein